MDWAHANNASQTAVSLALFFPFSSPELKIVPDLLFSLIYLSLRKATALQLPLHTLRSLSHTLNVNHTSPLPSAASHLLHNRAISYYLNTSLIYPVLTLAHIKTIKNVFSFFPLRSHIQQALGTASPLLSYAS